MPPCNRIAILEGRVFDWSKGDVQSGPPERVMPSRRSGI